MTSFRWVAASVCRSLALGAADAGAQGSSSETRRAEPRQERGARGRAPDARVPGRAATGASRRTRSRWPRRSPADPERNFADGVRDRRQRLRGRRAPVRLPGARPRARHAAAVDRAQRLDGLRARVGDEGRARPSARSSSSPTARSRRPRRLYWWAAQTLAKHGYVVLTLGPAAAGPLGHVRRGRRRRTRASPSQTEGNGVLRLDAGRDRLPALHARPAVLPAPEPLGHDRTAPSSSAASASGKNAAFNPYWRDGRRARASASPATPTAPRACRGSASRTARVDAVVAWDNLCDPSLPTTSITDRDERRPGRVVPEAAARATRPATASRASASPPTRSSAPSRAREDPDPVEQSAGSRAFSKAGVDTGSIAIRGGTHFEFSYLPSTTFRATLRGIDLAPGTRRAWIDKYVKGDPTADARLLSTRWRSDIGDREVDPEGGGNLFSFYFRSRLDVRRSRRLALRLRGPAHAAAPARSADDGWPARYSYLAIATSKDGTPLPIAARGRHAAACLQPPHHPGHRQARAAGCACAASSRPSAAGASAPRAAPRVTRAPRRPAARDRARRRCGSPAAAAGGRSG